MILFWITYSKYVGCLEMLCYKIVIYMNDLSLVRNLILLPKNIQCYKTMNTLGLHYLFQGFLKVRFSLTHTHLKYYFSVFYNIFYVNIVDMFTQIQVMYHIKKKMK